MTFPPDHQRSRLDESNPSTRHAPRRQGDGGWAGQACSVELQGAPTPLAATTARLQTIYFGRCLDCTDALQASTAATDLCPRLGQQQFLLSNLHHSFLQSARTRVCNHFLVFYVFLCVSFIQHLMSQLPYTYGKLRLHIHCLPHVPYSIACA
mmetsp:Transcript_8415/g.19812  ORF Transcript_8415/g.19812 Transcript_8415/m.19812 type:complete len:152 (+) Transcript_8415:1396-1851(+)